MESRFSALATPIAAALLASSAAAQSFNIDVANLSGSPAATYGAASGQVGIWNVLTGGPAGYSAATINDLSGAATAIDLTVTAVGNGLGDFSFNNAGTFGDDEFLMDDLQDVGNGGTPSSTIWKFTGMANSNYQFYVYAWAPDSAAFVSFVSECGGVETMCSGAWPGGFSPGVTHVILDVAVTGGVFSLCVNGGGITGNFSGVNGIQSIQGTVTDPGTALCFGDGTGAACPCGNTGGAGEGCANSTTAGGTLAGAGVASFAGDTVVLTANNVLPSQPGLFFQGDMVLGGGNGIVFGDGLRCAGMNVVRLGVMNPDANGDATWGPGLAVMGGWTSGDIRRFQTWYRDPTGSPCGTGFNLSHGMEVTFTP